MNKVYLIGNLTKDPETGETSSGTAYCRFSIAVTRKFANEKGEREADFFNLTAWKGLAETIGRFMKKGRKIAVVGSLQNRSYEDKDGVKRYATDIVVEEAEFLSPANETREESKNKEKPVLTEIPDDDGLPF